MTSSTDRRGHQLLGQAGCLLFVQFRGVLVLVCHVLVRRVCGTVRERRVLGEYMAGGGGSIHDSPRMLSRFLGSLLSY